MLTETPKENSFQNFMQTTMLSQPTGLNERPFSVYFSAPDATDRMEPEQFIRQVFKQTHGADIKRFMPYLMSLRDHDNKLVAVCGLRSIANEAPFLEIYLDQPVERVLSEHAGSQIKRNEIVEVGNFSVAELGMARYLITAINDQLYETSKQWAVFTAVPVLRNAFIKLGMHPEILGSAHKSRLPIDQQKEWGSYYDQQPQVMAIRRIERRIEPRILESTADAGTIA